MLYPNYDAITTKEIETLDPHSLVMQLKDVSETLNEREEELYLWRQKQDQYAEALSFNSMLEDELSRANEQILDLKSKVKNFIKREQVLLKEFSVDTHIQESYTTLFAQYQEALEKNDDLELRLEEITIKYQKLLPYVHKLVEVEANLTIALKEIKTMKQQKEWYCRL